MDHDLLVEPLLSWRDRDRHRYATTLPGLLEQLGSGALVDFPRVRPHQFHPWCMFLTQLAAIALHRAGNDSKDTAALCENDWRELLSALTDGRHEPWTLIVSDLSQPAFFQPPVPEGSIDGWSACDAPDDIDILVTAKNHDVKRGQIPGDDVEAWVYAITTLQTMQGVLGSGNYGIARMNKGHANRPRVGFVGGPGASVRFLRDVPALLGTWPELVTRGYRSDGIALVWTHPWDGTTPPLMEEDLSPHFIEACRRLRCVRTERGLSCWRKRSTGQHCLPAGGRGDVGDPWIPIRRKDGAALNVTSDGYSYERLSTLLFTGEYKPGAAQELTDADPDPVLLSAWALVRGEGGTEGVHERLLTLAGHARRYMLDVTGRISLGRRALTQVKRSRDITAEVFAPSVHALLGYVDGRIRLAQRDQETVARGKAELNRRIDEIFFDHLFSTTELDETVATLAFERRLVEFACKQLQVLVERLPLAETRRLCVISAAERTFYRCLSENHFPRISRNCVAVEEAFDDGDAN